MDGPELLITFKDTDDHSNFTTPISKFSISVHEKIFTGLKIFKNSDELSDIDVQVGGVIFKCHKIILSSWSAYFRCLFSSGMTEVTQGTVTLATLNVQDFADLLEVMYFGSCTITDSNVEGLTLAASYLQIPCVEKACIDYIKCTLNSKNSVVKNLNFLKIAHLLDFTELKDKILSVIVNQFIFYKNADELMSLSFEDMRFIVSSNKVSIRKEDDLCDVVFAWIEADPENRIQYLKCLVCCLRFLALSTCYMKEQFLQHPEICDNEELADVLLKCRKYLARPEIQYKYIGELDALPRRNSELQDVLVLFSLSDVLFLKSKVKSSGMQTFTHLESVSFYSGESSKNDEVAVCTYGRYELCVSNGRYLEHYNGLNGYWTRGPAHLRNVRNNCLVHDPKTHSIYSVTVNVIDEFVLIERYTIPSSGGQSSDTSFKLEYLEVIETKEPFCSVDRHNLQNRTCAYIIGDYLFYLQPNFLVGDSTTAVMAFNTNFRTKTYISHLPIPCSCVVALPYNDLVFLIDENCQNVLRVSKEGFCIEKYGEINHDQKIPRARREFGACIWNRCLIIVGGFHILQHPSEYDRQVTNAIQESSLSELPTPTRNLKSSGYTEYCLDSHVTTEYHPSLVTDVWRYKHCEKLTIDVNHIT